MNPSPERTREVVRSCPQQQFELASVATNSPQVPAREPRKSTRVPKVQKHSSGQARVCLSGQYHYLGTYGTAEVAARYAELVRVWEAAGRAPLQRTVTPSQVLTTVAVLVEQWLAYVDGRRLYWKQGKPTSHRANIKRSLDSLCNFWSQRFGTRLGNLPLTKFTSALLVEWRDSLELNPRLTRNGINRQVDAVKILFKWGKMRGEVPREVFWDISEVARLKATEVGERPERLRERRAVTLDELRRVAACASKQVGSMLLLQGLTAMRPGEVRQMRWMDIEKQPKNQPAGVWIYTVPRHKTERHGVKREIALVGEAQQILAGFPAAPAAFIFSPRVAMEELRAQRRALRKTPPTKQMRERDAKPRKPYGEQWSSSEYGRAVTRACKLAGVEYFSPHEARHGALTRVANMLGLAQAQALAGHTRATTTQRYVHADPAGIVDGALALQQKAIG